ncbi:MAG: GNAT family N-acetyltransferase, partial [Thermoleophilia bacterium]|nr:GNAT family N-acetyltransferase [Thermoleophilia bacterium]
MDVRPFRREDAARWVALVRELEPAIVQTPPGLLHTLDTLPARARNRFWTAWSGGDLVGVALGRLAWWTDRDDLAYVWAGVRRDARGRGVGARLYALAEAHVRGLGARRVETWTGGDDAG